MHVCPLFPYSSILSLNCPRYNDAMATIRRVSAVEHHFQLVITRVYEDGDQELLEDEDESA
jgi:hypothetical protein